MSTIVCVQCGKIMEVQKNGIYFVQQDNQGVIKVIYNADLYSCSLCKQSVISNLGYGVRASYPEFNQLVEDIKVGNNLVIMGEI